jgi:hypothetical protein
MLPWGRRGWGGGGGGGGREGATAARCRLGFPRACARARPHRAAPAHLGHRRRQRRHHQGLVGGHCRVGARARVWAARRGGSGRRGGGSRPQQRARAPPRRTGPPRPAPRRAAAGRGHAPPRTTPARSRSAKPRRAPQACGTPVTPVDLATPVGLAGGRAGAGSGAYGCTHLRGFNPAPAGPSRRPRAAAHHAPAPAGPPTPRAAAQAACRSDHSRWTAGRAPDMASRSRSSPTAAALARRALWWARRFVTCVC